MEHSRALKRGKIKYKVKKNAIHLEKLGGERPFSVPPFRLYIYRLYILGLYNARTACGFTAQLLPVFEDTFVTQKFFGPGNN